MSRIARLTPNRTGDDWDSFLVMSQENGEMGAIMHLLIVLGHHFAPDRVITGRNLPSFFAGQGRFNEPALYYDFLPTTPTQW